MASTKKLTIVEVKKRIKEIHGDQVILDDSTYINTRTKARFIDSKFGEWFAKPNSILRGGSHPKLRGFKSNKDRMISIGEIKRRLINRYGDIVIIDELTFKQTNVKARFIDKEYGEWWALPSSVIQGHGNFKRKCAEQIKPLSILPIDAIGTFDMESIDLESISSNILCGIYCILNTRNGFKYIGLSDDISMRFLQHKSKLRHDNHHSLHLQYAWNKYGEESFKFLIIEIVSHDQLNTREQYWMDYYKSYEKNKGYNINPISEKACTPTIETREKLRQARLGRLPSNKDSWKNKVSKEELIKFYQEGHSMQICSQTFGIAKNVVRRILTQNFTNRTACKTKNSMKFNLVEV